MNPEMIAALKKAREGAPGAAPGAATRRMPPMATLDTDEGFDDGPYEYEAPPQPAPAAPSAPPRNTAPRNTAPRGADRGTPARPKTAKNRGERLKGAVQSLFFWLLNLPVKIAANFDDWVDDLIAQSGTLDPARSMMVAVASMSLLITAAITFYQVDGKTQHMAYVSLGAGQMASAVLVILINSIESFGMILSSQITGLIMWAVATAWNVYWNVKFLPDNLSLAQSGSAWNLLLAIGIAAGPQFVAIVAVRVLMQTWSQGVEALGSFGTVIAYTPINFWNGIQKARDEQQRRSYKRTR